MEADDTMIEWMDEFPNTKEELCKFPESVFTIRATRDLRPPKPNAVPILSASALRQLANALDRLTAFHSERGGNHPDLPKLYKVEADQIGQISAHVRSGERQFRLLLVQESWVLD